MGYRETEGPHFKIMDINVGRESQFLRLYGLYGKTSTRYRLIVIRFRGDTFLYTTSTSTDSDEQKFVTYNLKIHIVVMFMILDMRTTFHTRFVYIVMIYPCTNFYMPNSNGSLVAIITKAK